MVYVHASDYIPWDASAVSVFPIESIGKPFFLQKSRIWGRVFSSLEFGVECKDCRWSNLVGAIISGLTTI